MEIGKEGLKFENGAFTYYGVSALTTPSSGKLELAHYLPSPDPASLLKKPDPWEPLGEVVPRNHCSTMPWAVCCCYGGAPSPHGVGRLAPVAVAPALTFPFTVHQSPVASLQSARQDIPPESADVARPSTYCPDYTVRALSDLQLVKVMSVLLPVT